MPTEKPTGRLKEKMVQAMMKHWDTKRWAPIMDMLGLSGEETGEHLMRILIIHLTLDRAVTAVLAVSLLNHRLMPSLSKIEDVLAQLPMSKRIELAKAAHLISASCAGDMKAVNTVRNKLSHYMPKLGFGVSHVNEISSAEAYQRCISKGVRALQEVVKTICQNADEIFPPR